MKGANDISIQGILVCQEEEAGEMRRGDDDPCSQRVPRIPGHDNDGDDDNWDGGDDCQVMGDYTSVLRAVKKSSPNWLCLGPSHFHALLPRLLLRGEQGGSW